MKPKVRINWCNWTVGVEYWYGIVYLNFGPVQVVW
jgi:hypothetical protein